ncbi:MAG: protein kinase [Gemmatales bacterium]|nr:MAG: protein kinase [Gemmatales bacterium]
MSNREVEALARQIAGLRLATPEQIDDVRSGEALADTEEFLRVMERKGYLTPFQTAKLRRGEKDGYFLGKYRLLYRISTGSFGRVFRADDPSTGKVYAVKVLRNRWSNNPRTIELFEREARVGMSLKHPNIVSILEVDRDAASRQHYIVMEFVEGGTLKEILAIRKKLRDAEALRLLDDAASGLEYAFLQGVTHRDIKLTNILVSSSRQAKLVDFGLAGVCAADGGEGELVDRSVDYAGLEQATGVPPGDVRSDIYFLGCVLYEMLSGRSPLIQTKDKRERMKRERFENVLPLSPDEIVAPRSVFDLVERMMSLDPKRRFQNPSQLLDALREARAEVSMEIPIDQIVKEEDAARLLLVQSNERLKKAMEDKFKEKGYVVESVTRAGGALEIFQQRPADVIVVDVGALGMPGVHCLQQLLKEARKMRRQCSALVLLSEKQESWAGKFPTSSSMAVLVRPVTLGVLTQKLLDMVPPIKL